MDLINSKARLFVVGVIEGAVDALMRGMILCTLLGLCWCGLWLFGGLHLFKYSMLACLAIVMAKDNPVGVFFIGAAIGSALQPW